MRECTLVTTADVEIDRLWSICADWAQSTDWQPDLAAVAESHGDKWAHLRVEEAVRPQRVVAVLSRFLTRMRIVFDLAAVGRGSRIRVVVQLFGPLALFHSRSFLRQQRRNLSTLVAQLVARARQRSDAPLVLDRGALQSVGPPWGQTGNGLVNQGGRISFPECSG